MKYNPFNELPGGYSTIDGTIDFYSRVRGLINSETVVLDLGAGRASWYEDDGIKYRHNIRLLKGSVAKVIAIDVDNDVLKNNSADECLIMNNDIIPVEDNSIDVIISDYVLEHINNPEVFFREVDRVLKSGGYFCARTPHKYCYVSIFAKLIRNKSHSNFLKKIQPERKEIDVFPTRYKLNTLRDISLIFSKYKNKSFIFRTDPSYYFGNKVVFKILSFFHRIAPIFFVGNLFIFLRKL